MLKQVQDPEMNGIKLTRTDSEVIVTKAGIKVTNFEGDDGNEYEQVRFPSGIVEWYRV